MAHEAQSIQNCKNHFHISFQGNIRQSWGGGEDVTVAPAVPCFVQAKISSLIRTYYLQDQLSLWKREMRLQTFTKDPQMSMEDIHKKIIFITDILSKTPTEKFYAFQIHFIHTSSKGPFFTLKFLNIYILHLSFFLHNSS